MNLGTLRSWKQRNGLCQSRGGRTAEPKAAEPAVVPEPPTISAGEPEGSAGPEAPGLAVKLRLSLCGCQVDIEAPDIRRAQLVLDLLAEVAV